VARAGAGAGRRGLPVPLASVEAFATLGAPERPVWPVSADGVPGEAARPPV